MFDFQLRYDPSTIPELAGRYMATPYKNGTLAGTDHSMEEAGNRLVNGPFSLADVKEIVKWKSSRRMDRFILNDDDEVEAAIRQAMEATGAGDVRRAVKALTKLKGVGVKMASAILTAMFPMLYTVCDFRASEALGQDDHSSLRYYVEYLAACRSMALRYGVSLRDFDRSNWQWSKEQKTKGRKCEPTVITRP